MSITVSATSMRETCLIDGDESGAGAGAAAVAADQGLPRSSKQLRELLQYRHTPTSECTSEQDAAWRIAFFATEHDASMQQ